LKINSYCLTSILDDLDNPLRDVLILNNNLGLKNLTKETADKIYFSKFDTKDLEKYTTKIIKKNINQIQETTEDNGSTNTLVIFKDNKANILFDNSKFNINNLTSSIQQALSLAQTSKPLPIHAVFKEAPRISQEKLNKIANIIQNMDKEDLAKSVNNDLIKILQSQTRPYFNRYTKDFTTVKVGNIVTIDTPEGETLSTQYAFENKIQTGDFAVIDGHPLEHNGINPQFATIGGLLIDRFKKEGGQVVFLKGNIRDSVEYLADNMPTVYALNITPTGPSKYNSGSINQELSINNTKIKSMDVGCIYKDNIYIIPNESVDSFINQNAELKSKRTKFSYIIDNQIVSTLNVQEELEDISLNDTKQFCSDVLNIMYTHNPSAERADVSTASKLNYISGVSLKSITNNNLAGVIKIVPANKKAILNSLNNMSYQQVLVIYADNPEQLVIDEEILIKAKQAKISGLVTNGCSNINIKTDMPIYSFKNKQEYFQENKNTQLPPKMSIQQVEIFDGYHIVGDNDGVAITRPEDNQDMLIGCDEIQKKEEVTRQNLHNGTAGNRKLDRAIIELSNLNSQKIMQNIISRQKSIPNIGRGSSGLVIPKDTTIKYLIAKENVNINNLIQNLAYFINLSSDFKLTIDPKIMIMNGSKHHPIFSATIDGNNESFYITGMSGEDFNIFTLLKEKGKKIQFNPQGMLVY